MRSEKVEQVLAENPSIEVVIDLHRDGVREDVRLVTEVNGKPTARIMFFNGLSKSRTNGPIEYLYNPYIADNLAFSFRLEYEAAQYYPDLTRCVYLKCYRYNLHVRPKSAASGGGSADEYAGGGEKCDGTLCGDFK